MTPRIAASLLLLVLLPVYIGSYPINHPTGKKDRARSLPVVISQYSSVRNSKNNHPTVTIVEPSPDDVGKKIAEQSPDNGKISQSVDTEKLPVSNSHDKKTDQHHKPSQEIISSVTLTSDNASTNQGQSMTNKETENIANEDKKKDAHEVSDSEKAVEQSENVNKPSATTDQQDNPEINSSIDEGKKTQDAEFPKEAVSTNAKKEEGEEEKPVKGSDEKTETVNVEKSPVAELTSADSSDSEATTAIKATTKVTTEEEGVAKEKLTEDKSVADEKKPEENSDDSQIAATTPVADEEEPSPIIKQEPVAIPAKEKTEVANKAVSKETNNSVVGSKSENVKNKAAADQSIIKTEVGKDTVRKNDEEHKVKQEDATENNEEPQVKLQEMKSSKPVPEEPASDGGVNKESKTDEDNNQMTPTKELKNGELFEEDRSFKGSLEEFSLTGIQDPGQFNKWSQLELSLGTNLDSFITHDEDDLMNENVRAERDDKKTEEKKEKEREKEKEMKEKLSEKEKIYGKPLNKETKSTKKPIVHSDDPVDEYPYTSRRKRSQEGDQKVQRTNDKIIGDDAPEPEVFSLVPNNYPVVLPDGESTLSDKLTPETEVEVDDKSGGEPEVFSLVPSNYPVVLPSGESTLSDKLTPETPVDNKSKEEPKVFSLVPSNYPVVLSNGESTLSDKVANESV